MRRSDRQVQGEAMYDILRNAKVARLAMADGDTPYLVPLNFGMEMENGGLTLYFHSAKEGRKIDILLKNPNVCVEVDGGHRLIEDPEACKIGFAYESVIGDGVAEILRDQAAKKHGLGVIVKHQTGKDGFDFPEAAMDRTCVFAVRIHSITGKRSES